MSSSDRTIKWIENLAEQELLISTGERGSIDIGMTKEEVLMDETLSFVSELFRHFESLVQLFNARVNQRSLQICLSRRESGSASFSLVRNRMRLSLSYQQPGSIQLQCDKLIPQSSSSELRPSPMFSGLIEAKFGAFHDVEWYFLDNPVGTELLARHYLTEFIQSSRAPD